MAHKACQTTAAHTIALPLIDPGNHESQFEKDETVFLAGASKDMNLISMESRRFGPLGGRPCGAEEMKRKMLFSPLKPKASQE